MVAVVSRLLANVWGCFPYQLGRFAAVRGQGAHLWDEAGRRHVDLVNAFGSVMLGHAHPAVVEAVTRAVASGVPAGGHALAGEVAERIAADVGPNTRVAFFKTGTEALRSVVMAARHARSRRLIVSAGFHGWDAVWAAPDAPFQVTAEGVFDCFYVVDALRAFLDEHAAEVAAAVIAPDYVHLPLEGLRALCELCRERGVPVIVDDVKFGYRFAAGPSTARHGIAADIHVFAKGLANGWPLACVAGSGAILDAMALHCSTLTYDAPSLAAAQATLTQLATGEPQRRIGHHGQALIDGARELLAASRLPIAVAGTGHAFQLIADDELEPALCEEALAAGLLLSPHDNQLPSAAFDDAVVAEILAALERALAALARRFFSRVGEPLTSDAVWSSAWHQMDGLPFAPAAAAREFIARRLLA